MRSHDSYRHRLTNTAELAQPDTWTASQVQRDGDGNAGAITLQVIEWDRFRARWMGDTPFSPSGVSRHSSKGTSCRHFMTAGVSELQEQHDAL
jgi:hypothetical protein